MRRYDLTVGMYDSRYAEEQEDKYHAALANVAPKGLILDVGCGTGLLFNYISPKAARLIGVDVSKGLLLRARERTKTLGNVSLIQADADHLPFRDEEFNVVFAFTVLQNMPKPLDTVREIRRIAQVGAVVAVTGLKKTFSVEALVNFLRNAGLHVVSVEDDEKLKGYVTLSLKRA
jgi:ubiquinone/menaquinone biosynthesis C-methylase UbiE